MIGNDHTPSPTIDDADAPEGDDGVLSSASSEIAFNTARRAVDRSAFTRYLQANDVDARDIAAVDVAKVQFRTLPLLAAPELRALSHLALAKARGPVIDGNRPFPASLWLGGASDTEDGRDFTGTVAQFVMLLEERATKFAAKRRGWVVEPTTNPSGLRTNEKTLAMHALFLDCDGTGAWDPLLATLSDLGYCYIAYQSGGWTPTTPKWRVVLPLAQPFETTNENKIFAWKAVYNHARVVFGAVAGLVSVGFDPATETPCCPWFLTERREMNDPPRQVLWRPGYALDLTALMLALPDVQERRVGEAAHGVAATLELTEERLNEIIDALIPTCSNIPSGRRDLYLSLPGALLDRGVDPDNVIAIVEAVSLSYPRKHADKHADNMHNARTTIAKWAAKEDFTRIGTLNSVMPRVAEALDEVLPDLASKFIADSICSMLGEPTVTSAPAVPHVATPGVVAALPIGKARKVPLTPLGREIAAVGKKLKKGTKYKLEGVLIGCIADGNPLPVTPLMSIDEMVGKVMRALGRGLVVSTRWQDVLDVAGPSLLSMDFTQTAARVAAVERAFYEGQGKRQRSLKKRSDEAADFKSRSFDEVLKKAKG